MSDICIYVVHAEGTNLFKIGQTRSLESRLRTISTYSPHPVMLVSSHRTNDPALEAAIHARLKGSHARLEWFRFPSVQHCIAAVNDAIEAHRMQLQEPLVLAPGSDPAKTIRAEQGRKIRHYRTSTQLSARELAERLGVTEGAVSQWETGRATPRQHTQLKIVEALGVSWAEIFGLDEVAA